MVAGQPLVVQDGPAADEDRGSAQASEFREALVDVSGQNERDPDGPRPPGVDGPLDLGHGQVDAQHHRPAAGQLQHQAADQHTPLVPLALQGGEQGRAARAVVGSPGEVPQRGDFAPQEARGDSLLVDGALAPEPAVADLRQRGLDQAADDLGRGEALGQGVIGRLGPGQVAGQQAVDQRA